MEPDKVILELLGKHTEGVSISQISEDTGHTRATAAKYLEVMKLKGLVRDREVGRARLWSLATRRRSILIAEDEEHIRRLITVILGKENYNFIEACDGQEALEAVGSRMPDLIILDLMMPKVDGFQVCKRLKENALTRKIPVLMLTAKREMSDKREGITAGANDYLTKPFEPRELRARVKTFLEKETSDRNPVTNLPTLESVERQIRAADNSHDIIRIAISNTGAYQKDYGVSRTNEMMRLTSHIIAHGLERLSEKSIVAHDAQNGFVFTAKGESSDRVTDFVKKEFTATLPFFYNLDYENLDMDKNMIIRPDQKGRTEEIAMAGLVIRKIKKSELSTYAK
ncbi:MAG: response regulator [archaeon]